MTMKLRNLVTMGALATAAVGLLWMTVPAIAHHAASPFYDSSKKAEAQGQITRLLLKNPHSFIYFEAEENGKMVEWQIELGGAGSLARLGWNAETLKKGTVIKVLGQPSRAEGSHGMCCAKITHPDGSPLVTGGRVTEEQQPPR